MKLLCMLLVLISCIVLNVSEATPLSIKDGPFIWMRASLINEEGVLFLSGGIRRTAPRTVRALRGHLHLYLDGEDGRELASMVVPYRPALLSRGGRTSSFALRVRAPEQPFAGGRLVHHLADGR